MINKLRYGLCVGGSKDGEFMAVKSAPFVHIPERPLITPNPSNEISETAVEIAVETYAFHKGLAGDFELDFWLPEGCGVEWALREIVNTYATEKPRWRPMEKAPFDEFVILRVQSGYKWPEWDYVQCVRHSNSYKRGAWVTAQNDHLTDSHTGEVTGWMWPPKEVSDV